jgi:hypothetical protein
MGNYSKLVGSLVGGAFGFAVARWGLPADLATPEIQGAVTVLFGGILTFIFPANKPS